MVVHLDNLRAPQKEKQITQHVEAKATSSATTGKHAEQHHNDPKDHEIKANDSPLPAPSSSLEADASLLAVKPPPANLPPHLRACLQAPIERHIPVETAPICRKKYKDLLRETIDGLVVVDPNDEAGLPVESSVPVSYADQEKDARVSEKPSAKVPEQPSTTVSVQSSTAIDAVVGSGNDRENRALNQPHPAPVSTSVPEWQAFADVGRGSQVSIRPPSHLKARADSELARRRRQGVVIILF